MIAHYGPEVQLGSGVTARRVVFERTYRDGRFWVLGPVVDADGAEKWGVVDKRDLPGQRPAPKPPGFNEFWPSEAAAERHADELNGEWSE